MNGLPHLVDLSTLMVLAGIFHPFLRLSRMRCGFILVKQFVVSVANVRSYCGICRLVHYLNLEHMKVIQARLNVIPRYADVWADRLPSEG